MTEPALEGIKQLITTPEPPQLGPRRRANGLTEAALNTQLDSLFRATRLSAPRQLLIRSLVLLWHDHLDAAHAIAQGIENSDGSFVHAIMHRREPDYWNSKYWWRRVGTHPAFPELSRRTFELLQSREAGSLAAKILPDGRWDPGAFVDACEAAAQGASGSTLDLLREIQRVETEVLLDWFCHD